MYVHVCVATCVAQIEDKHNMVQKKWKKMQHKQKSIYTLPIWQRVYTKIIDNLTQLK